MTNSFIYPTNKTSPRKILFSLMSPSYQYNTIKESNTTVDEPPIDKPVREKESQKSVNVQSQIQLSDLQTYETKLHKLEKMIRENKNEIRQFELLIQDKHEVDDDTCEEGQENQFHNILMKWLMKQVSIRVNGFDIQGVLTEISAKYLTLVVSESIYIIPLKGIDFVKLDV